MGSDDNIIDDNGEEVIILLDEEENAAFENIPYEDEEVSGADAFETEISDPDFPEDMEITGEAEPEADIFDDGSLTADTEAIANTAKKSKVTMRDEKFDDDEEDDNGGFLGSAGTKLVMIFGVLVAAVAILVGVTLMGNRLDKTETVDFSEVGNNVAEIGVIGEENIEAITTAAGARLNELYEAVKSYDYDEADTETGITTVEVTTTTILKDLKIKFVNKKNKLIANVPFQVEVTDPNGKTETWTDDDKDGIIYKTDLSGGSYSVKLVALEGYDALYDFSVASTKSVAVKTQLDYQKVDVSNEVKVATDTITKTEDTAVQDTEVESKLTDTVAYVISAKEASSNGYEEISKTKITDPMSTIKAANETASAGRFMRLSSTGGVSGSDTGSDSGSVSGGESCTHDYKFDGVGNNGTHTLKCSKCGATTTAACSYDSDGKCACGATMTLSVSLSGTTSYTYNGASTAEEGTITATVGGNVGEANCSFEWKITSGDCITIPESSTSTTVTVTAVKTGTATLTCTATSTAVPKVTASGSITITVTGITLKMTETGKKVVFIGGDDLSLSTVITGSTKTKDVLKWTSSDTNIATVTPSSDTKTATVKGIKAGTVTITATSQEDTSVKATITVIVYQHPKNDTATKLLDSSGNQVYVYDSSSKAYKEAVYADYYSGVTLYSAVAVTYKYTGWWTIDGKTYYFDSNGKKVTGEQVILGAKYTFSSDGVLKSGTGSFGIDVSTWNGTIDWSKVAKSGVNYAIIRLGFRGSSAGGLYTDNKFTTNIKNATAAGVKVGVYFFTQAITEAEAVEEASMCIDLVSGYKLTYPIFIDVESAGGRADNLSKSERTAIVKAFCKTVANSGYSAGVYANKYWYTTMFDPTQLTSYTIWLAQYATAPTYTTTRYDMWQYSSNGSISGISGDVDLDLSYLNY